MKEAAAVADMFATETNFKTYGQHMPMMGFQVSYKSLKYGHSEGNNRVPAMDELPSILKEVNSVNDSIFPSIHYYTKSAGTLVEEITAVMSKCDASEEFVEGIQINGIWPTKEQTAAIKELFPHLHIILQFSPKAVGVNLEDVMGDLKNRQLLDESVQYVIIDSSMGTGKEIADVREATRMYRLLKEWGRVPRIVFAGGLNGDNVKEKVVEIKNILGGPTISGGKRSFSIDAEGGLRDRLGDGYGNDVLNLEKVRSYLRGASGALFF